MVTNPKPQNLTHMLTKPLDSIHMVTAQLFKLLHHASGEESPGLEDFWVGVGFPSPLDLAYLEGHGDLVSRLILGIIKVTIWVIGVINLLTKSP